MVGRTTLAKAILGSIPNHIMQYIIIPRKIHNLIDRAQRNFIWGFTEEKKRMHMINWTTVTHPKHLGGLGVNKLAARMIPCFAA